MTTLKDIEDARYNLKEVIQEYQDSIEPCNNKECIFYDKYIIDGCSFCEVVEECKDYIITSE